ncbi:MAG: glycerol-3-phosphate transporter, partial [Sneathiella sp.]
MIENRPLLKILSHLILISGVVMVAFPLWITFVAATHDETRMTQLPLPLMPGSHFFENLDIALNQGLWGGDGVGVSYMLFNSFVMAMMIAVGKIAISIISAFAIVYFRFPFRMGF